MHGGEGAVGSVGSGTVHGLRVLCGRMVLRGWCVGSGYWGVRIMHRVLCTGGMGSVHGDRVLCKGAWGAERVGKRVMQRKDRDGVCGG